MRGKQKWLCLVTMVIVLASVMDAVSGAEKGSSDITYIPNNTYYELHVIVVGSGYLQDGTTQLRNGTTVYQLKPNDRKVVKYKADKGNKVKSILLDGVEMKDRLNNHLISITMMEKPIVLIVTFEHDIPKKEDDIPPLKPILPTPPLEEGSGMKKEIISVVTKRIPLEAFKNGITEELLRSYIITSANYKILSHNIQAKPGIYEIVIQFNDGTLQTIQVKVEGDKKEKGGEVLEENQCYTHWLILIMGFVYTGYMGFQWYRNHKCKRRLIDKISSLESEED